MRTNQQSLFKRSFILRIDSGEGESLITGVTDLDNNPIETTREERGELYLVFLDHIYSHDPFDSRWQGTIWVNEGKVTREEFIRIDNKPS